MIIQGREDRVIKGWAVTTGSLMLSLKLRGESQINNLSFYSKTSNLAVIFNNSKIHFLSLKTKTKQKVSTVQARSFKPTKVKYLDSVQAISYGGDNSIQIWTIKTGELAAILDGHTDKVVEVFASSGKGGIYLSFGMDKILKFWDLKKKICIVSHYLFSGFLKSVDVSRDKRLVLSCENRRGLFVYDITRMVCVFRYQVNEEILDAVWLDEPVSVLVVTSDNVRVLNLYLDLGA